MNTESKGFTLVEVIAAIAILGILVAIALPTYLSYPSRARESEALTIIKASIEAQQAYYLQFQDFAPAWEVLDVSAAATNNYTYTAVPLEALDNQEAVAVVANPKKSEDKAFLGAIATVISKKSIRFSSAICESPTPIKRVQKLLELRKRKLKCKGEL